MTTLLSLPITVCGSSSTTTMLSLPSPVSSPASSPPSSPISSPPSSPRPHSPVTYPIRVIDYYHVPSDIILDLQTSLGEINQTFELIQFFLLVRRCHSLLDDLRYSVEKQRDRLGRLTPDSVMRRVFEYLDMPQLALAEVVCKGWKRSLRSNEFFWRSVYEINWTLLVCTHPAVATRGLSTLWRKRAKNRYVIDQNWLKGNCTQQVVNYGAAVRAIRFMDDTLVTGGDDHNIQIWNMKSAEWKKALLGHTARVRCLSLNYLQRSHRIISGSDDKNINIWDTSTGICQATLQGHTSGVLALASNENFFISCSRDQTIRGWDLETGRCTLVLRGHTGAVRSVDILGHCVVSGSEDRQLGEWDLHNKLSIQTIRGHTASVGAVGYCPDHLVASGSHDTSIRTWDFRYNNHDTVNPSVSILNGHTMWVQNISVDGKRLLSGSGDHTIKLWDLGKNVCLRTYSDHYGYPIGDVFTDGIKMVSGDWRGQVRIWNFAGLKW